MKFEVDEAKWLILFESKRIPRAGSEVA